MLYVVVISKLLCKVKNPLYPISKLSFEKNSKLYAESMLIFINTKAICYIDVFVEVTLPSFA